MNSYDLSRNFIDFSFENPSKIKPNHYALYFFSIEHCNRLGWKKEFGLPTTMTMEAIGIKSYNTYIKTFTELIEFGFFKLIEKSKNQYSSNIIELSNNDKAHTKALDKAFIKHATKQSESTQQSIDSINKPIHKEPINNKQSASVKIPSIEDFLSYAIENKKNVNQEAVILKYKSWEENGWKTGGDKPRVIKNWKTTLLNTLPHIKENDKNNEPTINRQTADTINQNLSGWGD